MRISLKKVPTAKWIAFVLLVLGIIGYLFSAYTSKATDQPVRVIYETPSGKVLFDHKAHIDKTKYGLSCTDCHHHPDDEEEAINYSCNDCHVTDTDQSNNQICLDCHEQADIEGVEINNQVEPTHTRGECIQCHREFGRGPVTCNNCHG